MALNAVIAPPYDAVVSPRVEPLFPDGLADPNADEPLRITNGGIYACCRFSGSELTVPSKWRVAHSDS